MKRDSRPVSQQVLSGLKIGALLIAIGAGVGAGVLIGPSYIPVNRIRAYIWAYIWHLRHGNTIDVGQYRLPVPKQWFVEPNSHPYVRMFDLNTGDSIWAHKSDVLKGRTLSEWSEWVSRSLATSQWK